MEPGGSDLVIIVRHSSGSTGWRSHVRVANRRVPDGTISLHEAQFHAKNCLAHPNYVPLEYE